MVALQQSDSLILTFDLKQLYKGSNANTNLRITVNGAQEGPTYRPPFSGTPIQWEHIRLNLDKYKHMQGLQISFESSVTEAYAGGAGTANLIDNINIFKLLPTGVKSECVGKPVARVPEPKQGYFQRELATR